MNLQVIADHTVDLDLLSNTGTVIDIGCLGFEFSYWFGSRGYQVHSVDIQKITGPLRRDGTVMLYDRIAITDHTGFVGIKTGPDPQATKITTAPGGWEQVPCTTLEAYMESNGIELADLIKIDCEGSEHEIIMSLTKPPARQISIEFHLHTGSYSLAEVALMVAKLRSFGYKTVQHNYEARHGAGFNYWDSLFVLE